MASYTKVGNGKASGLPTGKLTDRQRCGYAAKTKVWVLFPNLIANKKFSMTLSILKESNKQKQWQQRMQQTKNLILEKIKILLISRCHHQKRLLYQRSKSRRILDLCHSRYFPNRNSWDFKQRYLPNTFSTCAHLNMMVNLNQTTWLPDHHLLSDISTAWTTVP